MRNASCNAGAAHRQVVKSISRACAWGLADTRDAYRDQKGEPRRKIIYKFGSCSKSERGHKLRSGPREQQRRRPTDPQKNPMQDREGASEMKVESHPVASIAPKRMRRRQELVKTDRLRRPMPRTTAS